MFSNTAHRYRDVLYGSSEKIGDKHWQKKRWFTKMVVTFSWKYTGIIISVE